MATSTHVTPRRLAAALAALALIAELVLVIYGGQPAFTSKADDGASIPPFSIARLDAPAKKVSDKDLATGRVLLLNFFSSWCGPCAVENPLLMKLKKAAPIVGINYQDDPAAAARYLGKLGNPYVEIGADRNGKALSAFGFDSIPNTLIVNKAGKIVYVHRGRLREKDVSTVILPMLAKLSR